MRNGFMTTLMLFNFFLPVLRYYPARYPSYPRLDNSISARQAVCKSLSQPTVSHLWAHSFHLTS